jgi:hypothetical protein
MSFASLEIFYCGMNVLLVLKAMHGCLRDAKHYIVSATLSLGNSCCQYVYISWRVPQPQGLRQE